MSIIFNNIEVENVMFNDAELDVVNFNDTEVFKKSKEPIEIIETITFKPDYRGFYYYWTDLRDDLLYNTRITAVGESLSHVPVDKSVEFVSFGGNLIWAYGYSSEKQRYYDRCSTFDSSTVYYDNDHTIWVDVTKNVTLKFQYVELPSNYVSSHTVTVTVKYKYIPE